MHGIARGVYSLWIGGRFEVRKFALNRSGEMFEGFACFLFSAGKSDAVLGRFPGSEVAAIAANRFIFPSWSLSGTSKRLSSLQWRDRAGVTPASLL